MGLPQLPELSGPEVLFARTDNAVAKRARIRAKRWVVHRDQQHHHLRPTRQDCSCGSDPAHPRHTDVHEHKLGLKSLDRLHRLLARARLAYEYEPRGRSDQLAQHLSEGVMVIDGEDLNVAQ